MARYRLICVAPGVPDRGSFDSLDEAIVNSDAHFEVYDSHTDQWVSPVCQEEVDAAAVRLRARCHGEGEGRTDG